MIEWTGLMWIVYTGLNWSVALCLVFMASIMRLIDTRIIQSLQISFVLEALMMTAGAHFFLTPIYLYALEPSVMYVALVMTDAIVASIACIAVYYVAKH